MAWLKIARLNTGPHVDSYIDGAGYMALAAELSDLPDLMMSAADAEKIFPDAWRGPSVSGAKLVQRVDDAKGAE